MKSMISFLLFIFTTIVALITGKALLYALMIFELLLGLCLIQYGLWMKRKVKTDLYIPNLYVSNQVPFEIDVVFENKSRLPISKIKVELCIQDYFSQEQVGIKGSCILAGNEKSTLQFIVQEAHYAKMEISIHSVQIFDFFHIFSWECEKKGKNQILYSVPGMGTNDFKTLPGSKNNSEQDLSNPSLRRSTLGDMYELKEFQPGDSMRQIHWKLSAKSEEFIVRDYIRSKSDHILVVLNPYKEQGSIEREEWDTFLERVSHLCFQLLEQKIEYRVVFSCPSIPSASYFIETKENIIQMLCACIGALKKGEAGFEKWKNDQQETLVQEIIEINLYEVAYRTSGF